MPSLPGQVLFVGSNLLERLEAVLAMDMPQDIRSILEMAKTDAESLIEAARRATGSTAIP